jgi:hypothetical protein
MRPKIPQAGTCSWRGLSGGLSDLLLSVDFHHLCCHVTFVLLPLLFSLVAPVSLAPGWPISCAGLRLHPQRCPAIMAELPQEPFACLSVALWGSSATSAAIPAVLLSLSPPLFFSFFVLPAHQR